MLSRIRTRLKACLVEAFLPLIPEAASPRIAFARKRAKLHHLALHSNESGINSKAKNEPETIVSLTTYGPRLNEAYLAIESIMQGSVKPDAIVLWLGNKDFELPLPITLQKQVERGLSIRRTKDYRSYKKIIPSLQTFPKATIVTIDDDIIYPRDFLKNLLAEHDIYPQAIVANMVMKMTRDKDGIPAGMLKWPYVSDMQETETDSDKFFFEGFAGVLYPAGSLHEKCLDEQLFLTISPTADDIWLNAMARLNATPIRLCSGQHYDFLAAVNPACQDTALYKLNNGEGNPNEKQLRNVWKHFNL